MLFIGFLFFLIFTPLIVLYVRGVVYDFKTGNFVKTGILAIRAQPSDARVFLNGRLKKNSVDDIKFLIPGEYDVSLQKQGYGVWHKRLAVSAGQVTWASPPYGSISLLFSDPPAKTLAEAVVDFYSNNDSLVYLSATTVVVSSIGNPGQGASYSLPEAVNKIVGNSGSLYLLTGDVVKNQPPVILVFNSDNDQFTDLTGVFVDAPRLELDGNGGLLALSSGSLYRVDLVSKTKTLILSQVLAFSLQSGTLYFISEKNNGSALYYAGHPPFSQYQTLLGSLPVFKFAQLKVTAQKQVFLLADGTLYLLSSNMQKLADNVSFWNFDQQALAASILHSGELDYYDSLGQSLNLVTRSGEVLSNPVIKAQIGYAFFLKNNQIYAIELDGRDNQNQYVLYQGQSASKFVVDDAAKNIFVLDNGILKSLAFR